MALSTERQKVTKILIFNDSSPSSTSPQPLSATTSDRSSLTTPRLKITPSTETTPPSHVSSSPAKQPASVSLFVIEEQVSVDCSPSPLCDFCRCVGKKKTSIFFSWSFSFSWSLIYELYRLESSLCIEEEVSFDNPCEWWVDEAVKER